jgi:integrase
MKLSKKILEEFGCHLYREEKGQATREKYLRDAGRFLVFLEKRQLTKEAVLAWKRELLESGYTVRSVNSMLASVNSLMDYLGVPDCKVKNVRIQRQTYCPEDKELSKAEYLRLLAASQRNAQLNLVLQTICGTGIRVSELQFFTVEAVRRGEITLDCKRKARTILIPGKLRAALLKHAGKKGITSGVIFRGRNGKPLDRSCIWRKMKSLCRQAGVKESKVFPHNLRKLFARAFYALDKDIAKLADILGHSSINTTRIYIMTTGTEHRRQLERLHLVL